MLNRIIAVILFFSLTFSGVAQELDKLFDGRVEIYFRFPRESVNTLQTNIFSIVTIDQIDSQYFYAYANKRQMAQFLSLGLPFEKLTPPSMLLKLSQLNMKKKTIIRKNTQTTWNFYPTYSNYLSIMQQFQSTYPGICKIDTIGYSVQNRLILVAKISDNVAMDEAEPKIFLSSTMHGDETTGYVLLLHLIDYLLSNYGTLPRITNIVNNAQLYINPLANPDGTYAGGNNTVNGATRYNANGEDLNRNFPVPDGSQGDDGTYAQEIETQKFVQFAKKHNFVVGFNYHGGAELANYPWDYKTADHPDRAWFVYVSKEYADTAQFNSPAGYFDDNNPGSDYPGVIEGATWYIVKGSRQDFSNYNGHCREVTLEISSTKLPPASSLENYWNYNYRSILNFIEQGMYGIRGIVTDACTGQPIKALITILSHDADSSHVYSSPLHGDYYRPIIAGTWNMSVSAPGYQTATINNVTVTNKSVVVRNVSLIPNSPTANFIANKTYTCDGKIQFTNTGTYPQGSTFLWSFGDGSTSTDEHPFHEYTQNGTYTVKLKITSCAGIDSMVKVGYIVVDRPDQPVVLGDTICGGQSATLTSTGSEPHWFSSPGGQELYVGNTWITPPIFQDTTFYVSDFITENYQGGKPDSAGVGGYYTFTTQHGLVFSCTEPVTLKSVTVYANSAGNRTITLKDENNNTVWTHTVNVSAGMNVINIQKPLPVGNNMKLLGPPVPNLFRNGSNTAPDLPYPYNIGNVINITSSTATTSPYKYYYYFYNWVIEKSCQSAYAEVPVKVNPLPIANFYHELAGNIVSFYNTSQYATSYYWNFGDGVVSTLPNPVHEYNHPGQYEVYLVASNNCGSDTLKQLIDVISSEEEVILFLVFPNPVEHYLNIEKAEEITYLEILTIDGKILFKTRNMGAQTLSIDFSSFEKGLYMLVLHAKNKTHQLLIQKK
ncbi:MAG: M14 family zinc carboxypeptidase [Bacteroidales bacterium]|nr:M14 family zinc carboxypeptidase [Bacteroidales bacterium]